MVKFPKPRGRSPIGAIWNYEAGCYEYTKEFFDAREAQLKETRIRQQNIRRERMRMLRVARPHLFKGGQEPKNTLDVYIKHDNCSTNTRTFREDL